MKLRHAAALASRVSTFFVMALGVAVFVAGLVIGAWVFYLAYIGVGF